MSPAAADASFQAAYHCHRTGRLADAEAGYRRVLAGCPDHAKSLHYLGLLAQQAGHPDAAVDLIRRAVAARPDYAEAYSNLGNVLHAAGRVGDAIEAHRRAIAIRPEFAEAFANLGLSLAADGQAGAAIEAQRHAISLRPDYPEAHNNLGVALAAVGRIGEAAAAYGRATDLRPAYPQAHANLGEALWALGRADEGVAAFGRAAGLVPGDAAVVGRFGRALRERGRIDEAVGVLTRAVQLRPGSADAHFDLGNALSARGDRDGAVAAFNRAAALAPGNAVAHGNLGDALLAAGRPDDAADACRRAIALRPDLAEAHVCLGNVLKDGGRVAEAVESYRRAAEARPGYWEADSNRVYSMLFDPRRDGREIADAHRGWARQHAAPVRPTVVRYGNDRDPGRRLRLGYLSPNFRDHVVGRNLLPLFRHHDRAGFDVTCYAQGGPPDAVTDRFRASADRWRDVDGLPDEAVAELVRGDEIDVLVDLTVHMAGHRLLVLARRPAPVQVTFAGYPGTTGMAAVDYRLTDPYLDPPGADESGYAERSVRLPHSFWCYDPGADRDLDPGPLPAAATGKITFGCLNNFCKVNDDVLRLWARVLRAVAGSRLLLSAAEGSHRGRAANVLAAAGVDPGRVEFVGRQSHRTYLELYRRIDVGLDTVPYNGHTTSLDGLWMGVPVVTRVGPTVVGRAGLSQLTNLGLTDLVAETADDFVDLAVRLAGDRARLAELRATLRPRMESSPLMDAAGFARGIESAYRGMWRTWASSRATAGDEP